MIPDVELSLSGSETRGAALPPDPDLSRRRIGLRGNTNFPVAAYDGKAVTHCRAVEISSTGIVLDRGRQLGPDDQQALLRLQLFLPGRAAPIRALARPVRQFGTSQALKFIAISDVDRLTLTEHLDRRLAAAAQHH